MPQVLIVDDDREGLTALSNRLRFAFRRHALKVDSAEDAATGLILAYEGPYDALLVDMLMPGVNGIKFVEQLRRTQPNVPIIMMSGELTSCEEHAGRLGLIACLAKPIEFGTLLNLLTDVLDLERRTPSMRPAAFPFHLLREVAPRVRKALHKRRSRVEYARLNTDDQHLHTS